MTFTDNIRFTNHEVTPMFKKLFKSVVDICRPGVDESACQWGEATQAHAENSAELPAPDLNSRSEQIRSDPTQPYNPDQSVS
jgi:hypothetical protein